MKLLCIARGRHIDIRKKERNPPHTLNVLTIQSFIFETKKRLLGDVPATTILKLYMCIPSNGSRFV